MEIPVGAAMIAGTSGALVMASQALTDSTRPHALTAHPELSHEEQADTILELCMACLRSFLSFNPEGSCMDAAVVHRVRVPLIVISHSGRSQHAGFRR
jgi:hypothetical protein